MSPGGERSWVSTERVHAPLLDDDTTLEGQLHLQPRVAHRDAPETVLEMLNRDEGYFPMTLDAGGTVFVSKALVAVVEVPEGPATADTVGEQLGRSVELEVTLRGGERRRGVGRIALPPVRTRALDYVNSQDPFLSLHTPGGLVFVGRAHVRFVRPID